jgi:hypothetical protein
MLDFHGPALLIPVQYRLGGQTQVCAQKILGSPGISVVPSISSVLCDDRDTESWLQEYVNHQYAAVPKTVSVSSKKRPLNDSVG